MIKLKIQNEYKVYGEEAFSESFPINQIQLITENTGFLLRDLKTIEKTNIVNVNDEIEITELKKLAELATPGDPQIFYVE